MKFLRRMLGWFLISLGIFVLGWGMAAKFIVHTVHDGSVFASIASTVLHESGIQDTITQEAQSAVGAALAANGIDPAATGQQQVLNDAIAATVRSESFIDDVVHMVQDVEQNAIAQLTDDSLPQDPLVLTFDISAPLYNSLGAIPEVANLVPPTQLTPISVQALSAEDVGNVRNVYRWVDRVATWALWIGLGLIALGVLALPRRRWIIPRLLLGGGIVALLAWFGSSKLQTSWIIDRVGGDAQTATTVNDLIPQANIDRIQSLLWKLAVVLLVLAAASFVAVWAIFRQRKEPKTHEEEPMVEAPPPVPVAAVSGAATTKGETAEGNAAEGDANPVPIPDDVPFDQDATGPAGIDEEPSAPR